MRNMNGQRIPLPVVNSYCKPEKEKLLKTSGQFNTSVRLNIFIAVDAVIHTNISEEMRIDIYF